MTDDASALRAILTPRALAAWAGTDRLSALAFHLPDGPAVTPVARLFALLVAGDEVDAVPDVLAPCRPLLAAGLVAHAGSRVRARTSVLPLGRSLLVCDRLDADHGLDVVSWPDDSSYHLALAIPPGRRRTWLDIGCGSGFAFLLRPELATHVVGAELNPRAVDAARHGVALSALEHVAIVHADLTEGVAERSFELVTCNAPIPADVGPRWRATADASFFSRLFEQVPRVLAKGGLVVVHAALDHVAKLVAALPGERVVVSYVPEGGRQFGVVWWRPDATPRHVVARRLLTLERPHLTHSDRDVGLSDE